MTEQELFDKIRGLAQVSGYEETAQALVEGSEAVFHYLARELGASGFQAEWASLTLLGKLRRYDEDMPFGIITGDRMLYPQYAQPHDQALEWQEEWHQWAANKCKELLEESGDDPLLSPRVKAWWENMAKDAEEVVHDQ